MRTTRLFACLVGFSALVTFNACQDHLPTVPPGSPAGRLRVKSLAEELPGNQIKLTTFAYDAQGRLSASLTYQSPDSATAQVERNTYQYNAQNQLSQHQRQAITRPGAVFAPFVEQYQFTYNGAGQVADIRYSSVFGTAPGQTIVDPSLLNNPNALVYTAQSRYNAANRLTGSTRLGYSRGAVSNEDISEYSYTGDNVTVVNSTKTFFNSTGGPTTSRQQIDLTYDAKANPFYGVYVIPNYFGTITTNFPNLTTFSRNNITGTGGVTYRYDYNADDLPTARYTITDKVVQTLRFEYESY